MEKLMIDVSYNQEFSDEEYDALARQISGAIIRSSVTFWGDKDMAEDSQFERHYTEFKKRNVPVGAYHYSGADTPGDGVKEAEFMLSVIEGKTFELPVWWDVEEPNRHGPLEKPELSLLAEEFCSTMESRGYFVGIYANLYYLNKKLDMDMLAKYDVWVAQYDSDTCDYTRPYGIWQYSDNGYLDGYDSRLDVNKCYKDYPTIIKNAGLNGFPKSNNNPPTPEPPKTPEIIYTKAVKSNGIVASIGENCVVTEPLYARYWPTIKAGPRFLLPGGHQVKVVADAGKADGYDWLKVTYKGPSEYEMPDGEIIDFSRSTYTDYVASKYLR